MRGYRRRSGLAYLLGVAAACGLTFSVIAALLQLPDTAWWGLRARADGIVRRVAEGSPAARAGVEKSDRVILFGGQPWALSELVSAKPGDTVRARIRATDDAEREVALRAEPMPGPERVRKILFGVVALSFLLTGLVVYLSRSDAVANLFAAMCLLFAHQVAPAAPPTSFAGLFAKKLLLDLSTLALPSVVLHFFLLFPQRARFLRAGAYRSWLLYVPAILAMPLAIRFDLDLFQTGRISSAAEVFEATSALVFVAMIAWGVASFLRGVRSTESPPLRKSLRWVLPGTAAGILPPLAFAALLNVVPDLELPFENYAFATLVLVPLTFGHAIVRYGLLDLQLVVKRSVLYAAVTAAVVVAYWLVAEIVAGLVGRSGNERTIVSFAVIFAAALLSIPARERIDRWLDHLLYRDRFDYRRTVRRFSNHFATMIERDQLGQLLVNRIPELLQTERAVLFLRTSRDEALRIAGTRGLGVAEIPLPIFHPSRELQRWWSEYEGPVPVASAERTPDRFAQLPPEEAALLEAIDPRLLVFLPRERRLEGLLLLGPKASGERYRADEFELLATLGDQGGTALASSRLHEEALERRRLEEELAVAKRIQSSLLPTCIPAPDGIEIAALTRPCREIGGDFYDFLELGVDGLGLAVADVSGKGVPAALILSGLQATLRAEASPDAEPGPIVQKVNRRLCQAVESGNFATLLYGHLDVRRRSFRYVNAGHPAGLVVRRGGAVQRLEEGGLLLGMMPGAEYEGGETTFSDGDLLVLYSDGVTDVLNAEDEEFGLPRLERLLPRLAHLDSRAVIDGIVSAVEQFVGGAPDDDVTILVARFRATPPPAPSPA